MMQTTKARHSDHGGTCHWPLLDGPLVRGVFDQRLVHAVLMVVAYVVTHEPAKMLFVQHDEMVQELPAATPHPSFRGPILQGDRMLVRFGVSPVAFKNRMTSWSNFASRSRI